MTTNREFVIFLRLFIHHLFRRSGLSNRLFRLSNRLFRLIGLSNLLFLFLLVVAVLPLQINTVKKGRQNSTSRSRGR